MVLLADGGSVILPAAMIKSLVPLSSGRKPVLRVTYDIDGTLV